MPKVNLTDAFCRSARPVGGKLTEFADTKERGLALRVTASGVKSWTFRFRNFAHEQRRLSLGRFDDVSLVEARGLVVAERAKVHNRQDPVILRKVEKGEAVRLSKLETVAEIGERYFIEAAHGRHKPNAKRPKRKSTIDLEKGYFDTHVVPRFGKDKLAELSRGRIQAFINDVATDASQSAARQCKVVLHAIFNFATWQELAAGNPCQFVTLPQFASRERTLTDAEIEQFWLTLQNIEATGELFVSRAVAVALLLATVTLQRRAEISGMRKVELDRRDRVWIIPGERTKNHRTHVVPLSESALVLIDVALQLAGDGEFVFPSPRVLDRSITPAALSHAFRRICKAAKLKGVRLHDLRRTGATALTSERLGFPRFIVSRVLNHASDTGGGAAVTGVYDRNTYLPEKRRALGAWALYLQEIVGAASNVVELRA